MRQGWIALASLAALAGCDGTQPLKFGSGPIEPGPQQPVDPEDPDVPPPDLTVPEVTQGNLRNAAYNANADTLTVTVYALDGRTPSVQYNRAPSLDVPGFEAYAYQDDPLDRLFIGQAAEAPDGSTRGVVVVSGGQFNRYFGGVDYERGSAYSQPDSGLVEFNGAYAGMLNVNYRGPDLLPVPPGTPSALLPGQPFRVSGNVFFNVDWSDQSINGAIIERTIVDTGEAMPDLALIETGIGDLGTFAGSVEPDGAIGDGVGRYTGLFGGTGATSLAGGLRLEGDFTDLYEDEEEYGVFVLVRCGLAGDSTLCDSVNP